MKTISTLALMTVLLFTAAAQAADFNSEIIDTVKITQEDLPKGFMFGKIPDFAKKILKNNPWRMDRHAIKMLTGKIYPGGDYNSVADIHSSILARSATPYGDDIVCYIILYRDSGSSKKELAKLKSYSDFNNMRSLVIQRKNLAVFIFSDETRTLPLLMELSGKITKRIDDASRDK